MAKKTTAVSTTASTAAASAEADPTKLHFPFKTILSFAPLIEYANRDIGVQRSSLNSLVSELNERLSAAPRLQEPIEDIAILDQHRESVDWLMSLVFPPAFWDRDYSTAIVPFQPIPFYSTPAFRRTFFEGKNSGVLEAKLDEERIIRMRTISAYVRIARQFFNLAIDAAAESIIIPITHPDRQFLQYYRIGFDMRFVRFVPTRPLPTLTDEQRQQILCNLTDIDTWQAIIPPDLFRIEGFVLVNAVDVSDHELVSALERELVQSNTIVSYEGFQHLQEIIRAYLRRKDLVIGLVAMDGDSMMVLNYGTQHPRHLQTNTCVLNQSFQFNRQDLAGSAIGEALDLFQK
ncbi:MAG: hypothetical protein K1X90_09925 [Candidatus Kapabacteria bacterium]|nr:hypothetical protein [Candidatus Kapabacteria bacterium]